MARYIFWVSLFLSSLICTVVAYQNYRDHKAFVSAEEEVRAIWDDVGRDPQALFSEDFDIADTYAIEHISGAQYSDTPAEVFRKFANELLSVRSGGGHFLFRAGNPESREYWSTYIPQCSGQACAEFAQSLIFTEIERQEWDNARGQIQSVTFAEFSVSELNRYGNIAVTFNKYNEAISYEIYIYGEASSASQRFFSAASGGSAATSVVRSLVTSNFIFEANGA